MLDFIRRERIYIPMLFFILAVNLINTGQVKKKDYEGKAPLSTMSFKEAGITEQKLKDFFESGKVSARFFRYAIILGFFIFIVSLILNIIFIFRKARIITNKKAELPRIIRRNSIKIRDNSCFKRPVAWGILDLIRATIIIVFIGYIIAPLEGFIFRLLHFNIGLNLRMMLGTFFIDIAAAIILLYFVMVKYKERIQALGLKFSSFFRNILSGVAAYIFILPFLLVILILSLYLTSLLGYSPPPQPVFEVFMEEKRNNILLFLTIFVSIFGPIIEEMYFRGFMYSAIKKHFGALGAAILSASIFSLLHTNIVGFLPIMALGVVLAYLYEATGSLVASMAVHIIHNSVILVFVFFIKELVG